MMTRTSLNQARSVVAGCLVLVAAPIATPVFAQAALDEATIRAFERAMIAMDAQVPGTGPHTTPAVLFGQPDSAWMTGDGVIAVEHDGRWRLCWTEGQEQPPGGFKVEQVQAMLPYLADADGNGAADDVDQFAWLTDTSLGWIDVAFESRPGGWNEVRELADGTLKMREVWFEYAPQQWCVAELGEISVTVAGDELLETGDLASVTWHALLPMTYVTTREAAEAHIQAMNWSGPFAAIAWLRGRSTKDGLQELTPAISMDIPSGEWNGHDGAIVFPILTDQQACRGIFEAQKAAAYANYTADRASCSRDAMAAAAGSAIAAGGTCCKAAIQVGQPDKCLIGAIGCGIAGGVIGGTLWYLDCVDEAAGRLTARLANAQESLYRCCAGLEDCVPNGAMP